MSVFEDIKPPLKILVDIRKNATGEIKTIDGEISYTDQDGKPSVFWWEGGNAACDCNRGLFFGDGDIECSDNLYDVRIKVAETGEIIYNEIDQEEE